MDWFWGAQWIGVLLVSSPKLRMCTVVDLNLAADMTSS